MNNSHDSIAARRLAQVLITHDDPVACAEYEEALDAYVEAQLAPVREHLLGTVIRNTEAIAQSQMAAEPVLVYDPRGNGAADFTALTAEILRHG